MKLKSSQPQETPRLESTRILTQASHDFDFLFFLTISTKVVISFLGSLAMLKTPSPPENLHPGGFSLEDGSKIFGTVPGLNTDKNSPHSLSLKPTSFPSDFHTRELFPNTAQSYNFYFGKKLVALTEHNFHVTTNIYLDSTLKTS